MGSSPVQGSITIFSDEFVEKKRKKNRYSLFINGFFSSLEKYVFQLKMLLI